MGVGVSYERGTPVGVNYMKEPRVKTNVPLFYRGTSLIRKCTPLGPYRRPMPRVLGGS